MTLTLVLDLAIAALLVATIASCAILHRRLAAFRRAKSDFGAVIGALDRATARAEAGIAGLGEASAAGGRALDEKIEAARALVDELSFLVEHGTRLAERLETAGRKGPAAAGARPSGPSRPAEGEEDRTVVERDLFRALRAARGG